MPTIANPYGPWQLTQGLPEQNECECNTTDYCALIEQADKTLLTLAAGAEVGTEIAGCADMTEACVDDAASFTINAIYNFDSGYLCIGNDSVVADETDIATSTSVDIEDTCVIVKVTISNNDDSTFRAFLSTNPGNSHTYSSEFTGNGTFYLKFTGITPGAYYFGLNALEQDVPYSFCIETLTLNTCCASTWEIVPVNDGEAVADGTFTTGTSGIPQADMQFSELSLADGCYRFKISNCNEPIYYSNCFNIQESHACTTLIKYRNDTNMTGFDYSNANTYNYIRVKARLKDFDWDIERENFPDSSNNFQTTYARLNKNSKFSIEEIPEYLHEAIAIASMHRTFLIDGVQYVVNNNIKPDWRNSSNLAPVILEVTTDGLNAYNSLC